MTNDELLKKLGFVERDGRYEMIIIQRFVIFKSELLHKPHREILELVRDQIDLGDDQIRAGHAEVKRQIREILLEIK